MNDISEPLPHDSAGQERQLRREAAVSAAAAQGLVGVDQPVIGLLDLAALRDSAAALRSAFEEVTAPGQEVLHAFAVKAAPLVPVLRLFDELGLGCEVASPGELALARAAGVSAQRTVLDSPAKTTAELNEALANGIAVNVDNRQELTRLDGLLDALASDHDLPPLGLRINPQTGGGSIDAMSTATVTSKFGVALADEGARAWVIEAYRRRPWLNRLHVHTGSQGMPLPLMAEGVAAVYELAEEINAEVGRQQVTGIDLGGGLPVNFDSEATTPTFSDYARLLRDRIPGLFDGRYALVTEFGRSLAAKAGTTVARVEYVKSAGGRAIAVSHAGAQLAVRTVFAPEAWPLRIEPYDSTGARRGGPQLAQDVAGPCCFAGDLVARDRMLPIMEADDLVALLDTGAYYFSNPFSYNSLPRTAVYGYTVTDSGAGVRFATIRSPQTLEEVVAEAGADHVDALVGDLEETG